MITEIFFKIKPLPNERARCDFRGVFYTPAKTRTFRQAIQTQASLAYRLKPHEHPLRVTMDFFFVRPKSVKRKLPSVKPDLSNLVKNVEDALNGIVWKDDALICELSVRKFYVDHENQQGITLRVFQI